MLSEWVGSAPGVVEWYEPNQLWRVGSAYRGDDGVSPENATPFVKKWIRGKFLRFQESHEGRRIIEKSPTNVLRVKFVREIFPEAKLIHIYRDGRAALRSQIEKYNTFESYTITESDTLSRLRTMLSLVPFWEWPAYAPRFLEGVTRRYVSRRQGVSWFGLRYPGWQEDAARLSVTQLAAKQWVVAVETALNDLNSFPAGSWLSLRYEDVVSEPAVWFNRICEFCEIETNRQYLEKVTKEIHKKSLGKWKSELTPEVLAEAMPIMQPMLSRLGYLDTEATPVRMNASAAATT
jgi:hypothetical protein